MTRKVWIAVLLAGGLALVGCDSDDGADKLEDKTEEAVDAITDKADDMADAISDAAEKACEEIEDGSDKDLGC